MSFLVGLGREEGGSVCLCVVFCLLFLFCFGGFLCVCYFFLSEKWLSGQDIYII